MGFGYPIGYISHWLFGYKHTSSQETVLKLTKGNWNVLWFQLLIILLKLVLIKGLNYASFGEL